MNKKLKSDNGGVTKDEFFKLLDNLREVHNKFEMVPVSIVLKYEDNRLKDIVENVSGVENYLNTTLTRDELLAKIAI